MRWVPVLVILALAVIACTPQQPAPAAPATPPTQVAPAANTPPPAQNNTTAQVLPTVQNTVQNPAAVSLLSNVAKVKSYSFDVAFLPDGRAQYHYDVRGTKARVIPMEPLNLNGKAGDTVYVDFTQGTAVAYCTRPAICPNTLKQGTPVDFQQFNLTLPTAWVDRLKYGNVTRTLTFYDAPVTVIAYEDGGRRYEAYVHNFYGMPVRLAVATDAGMTDIVGGYEYRNMAFNTIRDSDVTPPQ